LAGTVRAEIKEGSGGPHRATRPPVERDKT
jgi:hypothetical protein